MTRISLPVRAVLALSLSFVFCGPTAFAAVISGVTPGSLSVSPSGSADYSLPIAVPGGINGLKPALSLNYSSASTGEGQLGIGWSIGGLSSISRCAHNERQDGIVKGINYRQTSARYCLDGQRLVPADGNWNNYDYVNREFRTEIDEFSKIIARGSVGTGPAYFEVYKKSGEIITYGSVDGSYDSRIETNQISNATVAFWSIGKIQDRHGNAIKFKYSHNAPNGAFRLDQIHYAFYNNVPHATVIFNYEQTPETMDQHRYLAGSRIDRRGRIKSIFTQVRDNGVLKNAKRYILQYKASTLSGQSLLNAIHECNGAGDKCFQPLRFTWSNNTPGFQRTPLSSAAADLAHRVPLSNDDWDNHRAMPLDFNGDAFTDLLLFPENPGNHNTIYLLQGKRVGFTHQKINIAPQLGLTGNNLGAETRLHVVDYDGDGRSDLLLGKLKRVGGVSYEVPSGTNTTVTKVNGLYRLELSLLRFNTVTNRFERTKTLLDVDLKEGKDYKLSVIAADYDSLPDILVNYEQAEYAVGLSSLFKKSSEYHVRLLQNRSNCEQTNFTAKSLPELDFWGADETLHRADFNADGLDDLLLQSRSENYLLMNLGGSFRRLDLSNPANRFNLSPDNWKDHQITLLDFNGDGLTDILLQPNNDDSDRAYLLVATGNLDDITKAFHTIDITNNAKNGGAMNGSWWRFDKRRPVILDANHDGLQDILLQPQRSLNGIAPLLLLSTGKIVSPAADHQSPFREASVSMLGYDANEIWFGEFFSLVSLDYNNDGQVDVLQKPLKDNIPAFVLLTKANSYNRITTVTDSLGKVDNISYSDLFNTSVYKKDLDTDNHCTSRYIHSPMQVVASLSSDTGLGNKSTTNYFYKNLLYRKHYGSQGFQRVRSKHVIGGQYKSDSVAYYHQFFPLTGTLLKSQTFKPKKTGGSFRQTEQVNTTQWQRAANDSRRYIVRNAGSSTRTFNEDAQTIVTQTTSNSGFDAYNNIKKVVVTEQDFSGSKTSTTTSNYTNNEGDWILGRLMDSTVTHSASGEYYYGDAIARKSSFTYYPNGSLKTEKVHYPGAATRQTLYSYDSFGNTISTVVSGNAINTRRTNYEYADNYAKRFQTRVINALNHSEVHTYDPVLEQVKTTTGPNGLTTRWEYDSMGRPTKETRADGTFTKIARYQSNVNFGAVGAHKPARAVLAEVTEQSVGARGISYSDLAGRTLRTVTFTTDDTTTERAVYQDTVYDSSGRVQKTSAPYFHSDTPNWSVTAYDHRDRPVKTTAPGNRISRTAYSPIGEVTVTDPGGASTKTLTNVLGETVRVTDAQGRVVKYEYDAIGNLNRTISGNSVTVLSYDAQGRKILMIDPDMGRWTYKYNVLDQLIQQTDAKNQSVYFDYDLLGRKVARSEAAAGQSKAQGKKTTWEYDDAPGKGVGKLHQVIGGDLAHKTITHYDELGRLSKSITWLDRSGNGTLQGDEIFMQEVFYNNQGQVESVKNHKTGLHYSNTYNHFGQLVAVSKVAGSAPTDNASDFFSLGAAIQATIQPTLDQIDSKRTLVSQHQNSVATLRQEAFALSASADSLQLEYDNQLALAQTALDDANALLALYAEKTPLHVIGQSLLVNSFDTPANRHAYADKRKEHSTLVSLANTTLQTLQTQRDQSEDKLAAATALETTITAVQNDISTLSAGIRKPLTAMEQLTRSGNRIEQGLPPLEKRYWSAEKFDAAGNVTRFTLGNAVTTTQTYDSRTHELNNISSTGAGTGTFQDLRYTYDNKGLLKVRQDLSSGANRHESLVYDALNRLQKSTHKNDFNQTTEYRYDNLGNITYKGDHCGNTIDTGCYQYQSSRPHAVTRAAGINYSYDPNGNMTASSAGRSIDWTTFNKPASITQTTSGKPTKQLTFAYGNDHQRIRVRNIADTRAADLKSVTRTTWHIDPGYQQIERTSGLVEHHHSIAVPGANILVVRHDNADNTVKGESTLYQHLDHLGSVHTTTGLDSSANTVIIERQHFDAFGRPLQTGTLTPSTRNPVTTEKGYTGHDMLTDFGLIHMNARLYDPALGRFLSPDTFVQSMHNTQALNRYSYVLNSPLNYTDPSGHFYEIAAATLYAGYKWARANPQEAIILASVAVTGATAGATAPWGPVASGFLSGAAGGAVSGGLSAAYQGENFLNGAAKGAALGGVMGAVSGGIMLGAGTLGGSSMVKNNPFITPLIHGTAGVTISAIQNRGSTKNWKSAFVSAAVSKIASNIKLYETFGKDNYVANATMAAMVGGKVSEQTGGDFANGARTAAFGRLFNDLADGKVDLTEHEGINGSHTIRRHIGKSYQQLLKRINESWGIGPIRIGLNEASSFSSLESANTLVSSVLSTNEAKISAFIESDRNTLVLNKTFRSITGRVVYRTGGNIFRPGQLNFGTGTSVRVVIRRNGSFEGGFNIHTAFPTRN